MILKTIIHIQWLWTDRKRFLMACIQIGWHSLPLVILIGWFVGSIITWQAAYQMQGLASFSLIGGQANKVIWMEMAPIMTSIVLAGRLGAAFTAEIGAMKLSEQLDALYTMGISVFRFVAFPKITAMAFLMPILIVYAGVFALCGSFAVCHVFLEQSFETFSDSIVSYFQLQDIFFGLTKGFIFGLETAVISIWLGLQTDGGAAGLGKKTIISFVSIAITILITDSLFWIIL